LQQNPNLNIKLKVMKNKHTIKFIDLFAGLGGIRLGFEQACKENGINTECVMTSEIKPYAIETLKHNHHHKNFVGDIFNVKNEEQEGLCFLKLRELFDTTNQLVSSLKMLKVW